MIEPKQGDRIGNYILDEHVGSGSFAQVWRAKHHVLDEVVAIKILTDDQYVRNFRHEGVAVHGLRHPNIVRAIDMDPYADMPYMIMEYVEGLSLRQVIEANSDGLPVEVCIRILKGVLSALQAAADAGIVHRDVKPANILLRMPHGDVSRVREGDVKLTDFGLGKTTGVTNVSLMQSGSIDQKEGIVGTLVYMSPEQRSGCDLDGRSDIYSCAVVLFEMLTGSRPAGSDTPSMIRSDCPTFLDEVFRCSYTRLERRYSSAAEMQAAIEQGMSAVSSPGLGVAARQMKVALEKPKQIPPRRLHSAGNVCPKCNEPVGKDDNFCIHCSHQLVDTVPRCPGCEAFVGRSDKYCIFCGSRLELSA